jgi:competence protein ComEC
LAFIVGVAIASFLPFTFLENDFLYFILSFIFLILTFSFWNVRDRKHIFVSMFFLFGFFVLFGLWRFSLTEFTSDDTKIWYYNEQELQLSGKIKKEPNVQKNKQKITLGDLKIIDGKSIISKEGNVLVTSDLYPEFNYGETLSLTCKLKTPEAFDSFAYDKYLARYNIYSICFYPKDIKKIKSQLNFFDKVYAKIFAFKNILRTKINQGMIEPESGLGRAMILGDMGATDKDLNDIFARTGLSHIVSISGSHIAVLVVILVYFFLAIGFWRQHLLFLVSVFLFFYIIMIGAPAAAVRSLIMGVMILWGIHLGRIGNLQTALLFAAFAMLLFNPLLLRYDIGFQLSFLAVFAIVFLHPYFIRFYKKITVKYVFLNNKIIQFFLEIISLSLLIQIITLPILYFNFKQFSLIAPVANLLVLWTLPFLLPFLLLALFLSFLFPEFIFVVFLPAKIILSYMIFIANFLEKIPFAYWHF